MMICGCWMDGWGEPVIILMKKLMPHRYTRMVEVLMPVVWRWLTYEESVMRSVAGKWML